MSHELDPKVGRWYRRLNDEQLFKVVSIDEDDGLVEIKTVDGEVEEVDAADWIELDLEFTEAPEDFIDPDEHTDTKELEEEDVEDDAKPKRGAGRASREDPDDEDDEDDDWDDDEDDDGDGYDSDR
jgi:hypothetical protein